MNKTGVLSAADIDARADQGCEPVIFKNYIQSQDRHSNILNNSYAGYKYGKKDILKYPVIIYTADYGAKPDGITDSSRALNDSITEAHRKGGGAVLIKTGSYLIFDEIWKCYDNVVLRGEGIGKTILLIIKSLSEMYKGKDQKKK